jgi:hypothetical protein
MKVKSRILVAAIAATLGVTALQAQAQTTWTEQASGGFGTATLPPDAQEWFFSSFGAGTYYWDRNGRVIANAEVTTNTVNPGSLTQIVPRLWLASDADLFKIQIVDPANFTAYVASPSIILTLFAADGTAIASTRGGGTDNALNGATLGLTAGQYFIGESQASGAFGDVTFGVARNNANQPLFDFTTDGVKMPEALADMKLSTDPFIAFTTRNANNPDYLIGPSTFTAGNAIINLTGADFSVVPEPGSLALLGLAATGLMARRRR